jgi:hypothetical protein
MVNWYVIFAVGSALAFLSAPSAAMAQDDQDTTPNQELTEDVLTQRILDRIPDIAHTEPALGRGDARPARAREHASSIIHAAQAHAAVWRDFAVRARWEHFQVETDLPALIAAMTMRESAFQSVVRLDDNRVLHEMPLIREAIPARIAGGPSRYRRRVPIADMGVMQVRAPSGPARACGVVARGDTQRLLEDLDFSYQVGTCILTNRLDAFIDAYSDSRMQRFRAGQRPRSDLNFYGVAGPRRGTVDAMRARELVVIERYNWGGRDLYMHPVAAGYARRVLIEFEYFRNGAEASGS